MAFQHPIHRPSRRAATPPPIATTSQQPQKTHQVEESQEWVLFSPKPPSEHEVHNDANAAHQTAAPITPRTLPQSRLSDFGSLDTAAVSERHRKRVGNDGEEAVEEDDDDDEADSLDEGLHAFNEPASTSIPSAHHCLDSSIADPVLPAHDGLGGFQASNGPVQQQLWQYERYNPQRVARGPSSLQKSDVQRRLDALNDEEKKAAPRDPTEERNRRIEKWRLDQSRAIMDEIERETRRRRRRSRLSQSSIVKPEVVDRSAPEEKENMVLPADIPTPAAQEARIPDDQSLWTRTSKMIRNLIGIDDVTLTYIFGEAKSGSQSDGERDAPAQPSSSTQMIAHAEQTVPNSLELASTPTGWETNLIARIARELGTLVTQLSEQPPNTFSTYMRVQETIPYAGMPTPPELSTPAGFLQFNAPPISSRPMLHFKHRRRTSVARTDPSLFGIEEEPAADDAVEDDNDLTPQASREHQPRVDDAERIQRDKDYWEQDLDFKMIFSYVKNRLRRRSSHLPPRSFNATQSAAPTFSTAGASGPDALRRAALIRHHHPLVSRNINALRASSQSNLNSQASQLPSMPLSPILGRRNSSVIDDGASSCASQSTKKSKTHHSGSLSMSSSRNYWDIGGPAGSWGEV